MKTFQTQDTFWTHCNGKKIVSIDDLNPSRYDESEVGKMFVIVLETGEKIEVFEDEIIEGENQ